VNAGPRAVICSAVISDLHVVWKSVPPNCRDVERD
jgi:hypothetical protein